MTDKELNAQNRNKELLEKQIRRTNIKEFLHSNYDFDKDTFRPLCAVIKDIAIAPFEIDLYKWQIFVIETTGATKKDANGKIVQKRFYRGCFTTFNAALNFIANRINAKKLQAHKEQVFTLREYYETDQRIRTFLGKVAFKEYEQKFKEFRDFVPFSVITGKTEDSE